MPIKQTSRNMLLHDPVQPVLPPGDLRRHSLGGWRLELASQNRK
jgi:hypothetical protein